MVVNIRPTDNGGNQSAREIMIFVAPKLMITCRTKRLIAPLGAVFVKSAQSNPFILETGVGCVRFKVFLEVAERTPCLEVESQSGAGVLELGIFDPIVEHLIFLC
jgi:hypothetical protein